MADKNNFQSKDLNETQNVSNSKLKGLKITDNISEISQERIANIPPGVCNPNNNPAFEKKSNPLSSKGN